TARGTLPRDPKVPPGVPTPPARTTSPGLVCDSALRRLPSRSSNSRFNLAVVTAANKSAASRIFSLHLSLAVRSTTLLGQVHSRPFHLSSVLPNFTIAVPLSIRLCTRVPRLRLARNLLSLAYTRQFSKRRTDFGLFAAAQREPARRAVPAGLRAMALRPQANPFAVWGAGKLGHPTDPSRETPISFCVSAMNSIGS